MGTLHGGVLCDIADLAMGVAYSANLEEGESFTTLELKINFLKPVWKARLRATGRVVKQGRTVGLVECDIVDEQDNLVAHATSTCMTLREKQAKGGESRFLRCLLEMPIWHLKAGLSESISKWPIRGQI